MILMNYMRQNDAIRGQMNIFCLQTLLPIMSFLLFKSVSDQSFPWRKRTYTRSFPVGHFFARSSPDNYYSSEFLCKNNVIARDNSKVNHRFRIFIFHFQCIIYLQLQVQLLCHNCLSSRRLLKQRQWQKWCPQLMTSKKLTKFCRRKY